MIAEPKINSDQLKKLWATAREAGISESKVYEIVLGATGSKSISTLNPKQAHKIINLLETECRAVSKQKPQDPLSALKRKLQKRSYSQFETARKLCTSINEKGIYKVDLNDFSMRQYKKPFDLLTRKQASGLIQGLIAILGK
ncbi:DUF1018 domain-containing protein [Leptospira borgpetersenii]|uniref:PF06252 family protein n=2 Tax=Leptospira borgpetersenii TaxID=174 RepID=M3GE82_LEPBO|nr:DUF1018 domain-containing protein [Leptospira borgpetersenii]EKP13018.1 PF06252 family protein [Leptospira borgpetersenii str. 200801926]EMF99256.1 PF06252 family protein [Leptospira borgpetersenii str. 200701203]ENO65582.1 PF06252 family protein [Leptospira borgpetersenii serovar Mini str. 201000851]